MTKIKNTKKALRTSMLSLVLCVAMLVGSTYAWFTDSVTSAGNIITSGTLDVTMEWADGTEAVPAAESDDWKDASEGPMFTSDKIWEPGYVDVKHIKIGNEGTLALKYKVNIIANGEVSALADVIDVYYVDPAVRITERTALTDAYKLGTLTQVLESVGETGHGNLDAGASDTITIALKMQESADNNYQDLSIGTDFSVKLQATQLTAEDDSFGDDYDVDATYPDTVSGTIGGGESLKVNNVEVTLPVGSTKETYTLTVEDKGVTTNENYETTVSLEIDLLKNGVKVEAAEGVLYYVTVDIGKNVVVSGVTHDGEVVANYTYTPVTGLLTFATDSFSPFTVSYSENVIRVNNANELINALNEIKSRAKEEIPASKGNNKDYRENAIFVLEDDIAINADTDFMYTDGNGAPLHFYGVRGILDLNGHTITVDEGALLGGKSYANAVLLVQYSNIDIVGEGSIIANNKSIPVYGWANGTVNIYGGTYKTNAYQRNESAVYVNNPSMTINVYGGTYTDSSYAFNAHDSNCGSIPVITLHEGVTYADFFKNGTDLTLSDINNGRIVLADGCELEKDGNGMNSVVKN